MPPDRVLVDACPLICDPFRDLLLTYLVDPDRGLLVPVWTSQILDEARRVAGGYSSDRTLNEINSLEQDFPDAMINDLEVEHTLRDLERGDANDFNAIPRSASRRLIAAAKAGACTVVVTCTSKFLRGNPFVEVNGPDGFLLDLYEDMGECDGIMPSLIGNLAAKGRMDRMYYLNRLHSCGCKRFVRSIEECFNRGGSFG